MASASTIMGNKAQFTRLVSHHQSVVSLITNQTDGANPRHFDTHVSVMDFGEAVMANDDDA